MSQNKDLILTAGFDDQTQSFFDQLARNFANAQGQSGTTSNQMANDSRQSSLAMGMLAGAIGGVTAKLTEMALNAAKAIPSLVMESTKLAASAQTNSVALGVMAQNLGYSADYVNDLKKQMIDMGIASDAASTTLLKLMGANVDLKYALDLASGALDTATVAGRSEEEVLTRTAYAIATKNTIMLGDLQLTTNMTQAKKEYAQTMGIEEKAIDVATEKQALALSVIKQMTRFEGARTKAMGTAGKQMANMGELATNLKVQFGQLFLPAYTEWVTFLSNGMAQLSEWFDKNSENIAEASRWLGLFAGWLIDAGQAAIKFLASMQPVLRLITGIPEAVGKAGTALAGLFVGQEEANARFSQLGETVKQVIVLITRLVVAGVEGLRALGTMAGEVVTALEPLSGKMFWQWTKEDFAQVKQNLSGLGDEFYNLMGAAQDAGNAAAYDMMGKLGMLPAAADDVKKVTIATEDLTNQLSEAADKAKELEKKITEELAQVAKQRARQDIDAAIQESRQREDMERNHQERLANIRTNYAKRVDEMEKSHAKELLDLHENANEQRIDAEIDYQRRLQDIKKSYMYDIDEMARKNDAVGIARAMRENERTLEQEKTNRDRGAEDRDRDFQRSLEDIKESQAEERAQLQADLEQQLSDAEEARQKDIENLNRSLERQREDTARHRAWEDEDRKASFEKEAEELGAHFASIEGMTAEHLNTLLAQHAEYLQDSAALWSGFNRSKTTATPSVSTGSTGFSPTSTTYSGQNQELQNYFANGGAFAEGGYGVVNKPTNMLVGERGPEAFAAMPLDRTVNHVLRGGATLNINGVSRQMEQDLRPLLYEAVVQLFQGAMA